MEALYNGKYENSKSLMEHNGWTLEQVNKYLPFLESADITTLDLILAEACITFTNGTTDKEQAVFVLCGGHDIQKDRLFEILDKYINRE